MPWGFWVPGPQTPRPAGARLVTAVRSPFQASDSSTPFSSFPQILATQVPRHGKYSLPVVHCIYGENLRSLAPTGLEKYTVDSNVSGHFTASKLGSNLWDHGYPAMLTWKHNWTHPEDWFSGDSMSTKRVSFLPLPRVTSRFQPTPITHDPLGSTRCSRCIKSTTRRLLSPQPAVKRVQCYQRKSWPESESWPMHAMLASTRSAVICPPRLHSLHFLANASELL